MATYTKYPYQIDTSTELPKATDLVTPVNGEAVNRLREAILAVENELGAQPSGTWSTVRARLDAMDTALLSLGADVNQIDPTIEILQDSVSINDNANAINFTGNVAVTDDGLGVSVEIIGGQATQEQEAFIATDGQTSFTLSETPFQTNGVHMYVNGVKMRYAADYTVSGTTVSYLDDIDLVDGDEVEFWYLVDSAGLVSSGGSITVQDAGVTIDSDVTTINFSGANITNPSPGIISIDVPFGPITEVSLTGALETLELYKLNVLSGSAATATLPPASTSQGRTVIVVLDANLTVSIVPDGTDTIDGSASYSMTAQGQKASFIANAAGDKWYAFPPA